MPNHDHELRIIGNEGRTDYEFEAIGRVAPDSGDSGDTVTDKRVEGAVSGGGEDVIGFNGAPKGIAFPGEVGDYRLELDGVHVAPFHLNMRTIEITSPTEYAPYELAVSGRVIGTASTSAEDAIIDGTRARGAIGGGSDTWHFSGVLLGVDSNQDLTVTVDNREIEIPGNPPVGAI